MVEWFNLLITLSLALTSVSAQFTLKILHINDHHSHLTSETFTVESPDFPPIVNESLAGTDATEIDVTYGGFPLLITLFDTIAAASETPVLKLHAGDALSGTLFFTIFEGVADANMMNFVCFDALTLGNHEFDNGDEALATFLMGLKDNTVCPDIPVLSANLVALDDSPITPLVVPYTIHEVDGEQIAIIGITTETTSLTSSPEEGTVFLDPVETAEIIIAEVTAMGVDKIIMLTHIGYDKDVSLIAELEGVDVVVGGHTHSLLGENVTLLKSPDGPFPTVVTHTTGAGGTVCVVQAWEYGHGLGDLNVEFDASGDVVSCSGGPKFPIDAAGYEPALEMDAAAAMTEYLESLGPFVAVEPNMGATSMLAGLSDQVNDFGQEVIATVPEPGICYERIPGQGRSEICTPEETIANGGGVCNLVAQAFLDHAFTADFAIQNAGGCRTDINAGDYSISNAFELLPFKNTLVTLDMTGEQIVLVLNQATKNAFSDSTGAYPYAAGLRYDVDANAVFPDQLTNVEINVRLLEMEWTPIDMGETYTVVTNSFVASGGDGYAAFGAVPDDDVTDLFLEYGNSFVVYARKLGVLVDPAIETYSTQNFAPMIDPETSAPATSAPAISVPETSVPETSAPATSVPETSAPATSIPETSAPETSVPETSVPATSAPETSVPETSSPVTSVPETSAPIAPSPDTSAPTPSPTSRGTSYAAVFMTIPMTSLAILSLSFMFC